MHTKINSIDIFFYRKTLSTQRNCFFSAIFAARERRAVYFYAPTHIAKEDFDLIKLGHIFARIATDSQKAGESPVIIEKMS